MKKIKVEMVKFSRLEDFLNNSGIKDEQIVSISPIMVDGLQTIVVYKEFDMSINQEEADKALKEFTGDEKPKKSRGRP